MHALRKTAITNALEHGTKIEQCSSCSGTPISAQLSLSSTTSRRSGTVKMRRGKFRFGEYGTNAKCGRQHRK